MRALPGACFQDYDSAGTAGWRGSLFPMCVVGPVLGYRRFSLSSFSN